MDPTHPAGAFPGARTPGRGHARKTAFARNVFRLLTTQAVAKLLNVATGILTARMLGPRDRGLYSILFLIPQTLEIILKMGIAPANVYMICRQKVSSAAVLSNSVLLALGLGSVGFAVLPFQDIFGTQMLANLNPWYLTLALSLVPCYLVSSYLESILHARNDFRLANWRKIIGAAGRLGGTSIVLVVLGKGLFEAFLVNVAVGLVTSVWLLATVVRLTSASFEPDIGIATATVRFGVRAHMQGLVTALHLRLDHYLIALFLDPAAVAFYAIATHVAELVGEVHRSVGVVLYPRLSSTPDERTHQATVTACRHVLVLEAAAALVLVLAAKPMIAALYGRDYLPAVEPFVILLPGVLMLSLSNLVGRYFTSRNRQAINIVAGLVAVVVNIVLNILLIPPLGIDGAAVASTISYSLAGCLLLAFFRRDSGASLLELIRLRRSDVEFYRSLPARLRPRSTAASLALGDQGPTDPAAPMGRSEGAR